jgi:transposase
MGAAEERVLRITSKRRYRSAEEKRLIVEATLASDVSVATVARQHGVNANQVFAWRKLYQSGLLEASSREPETDESRLLPVAVVDDAASADAAGAEPMEERTASAVTSTGGVIHIEFPGRALVSVEGCADPALVRAVLETLRR